MLNFLYRLLLTFNSTSWVIVLFGVKEEWTLWNIPIWLFDVILLLIPVITSIIALWLTRFFGDDNLSNCTEVEYANSSFIQTYLGYFFVGLSLANELQLIFVYLILFIFTFTSCPIENLSNGLFILATDMSSICSNPTTPFFNSIKAPYG